MALGENWIEIATGLTNSGEYNWIVPATPTSTAKIKISAYDFSGNEGYDLSDNTFKIKTTKDYKTLIVFNETAYINIYNSTNTQRLLDSLSTFSNLVNVDGLILKVNESPLFVSAFSSWQADLQNSEKANDVARVIRDLIESKLGEYPNIEYILIVGDDRCIPYYRFKDLVPKYKDREHSYLNEPEASKFRGTTIGYALEDDMTLIDDFYATPLQPWADNSELLLPAYSIGRLPYHPNDVIDHLNEFKSRNGILTIINSATSGDGFMADGIGLCYNNLLSRGISAISITNFSDYSSNMLNNRTTISFTGLHSTDANMKLPDGSYILTSHIIGATANLFATTQYNIGCHTGLYFDSDDNLLKAFGKKGVITISQTGYGWSGKAGILLSERLMADFSEVILNEDNIAIGQALSLAKMRYYEHTPLFFKEDRAYNEKIVYETVLYGLPMWEVSIEPSQSMRIASSKVFKGQNYESIDDKVTIRKYERIGLSASGAPIEVLISKNLADERDTTEKYGGIYYSYKGWIYPGNKKPVQPMWWIKLGDGVDGKPKDFIYLGGTYIDIRNFIPVNQEYVWRDYDGIGEASHVDFNPIHNVQKLSNTTTLAVKGGNYNYDTQTERLFDRVDYIAFYSTLLDTTKPNISSINVVNNTVSVACSDNKGIYKVYITYTTKSGNNWSGEFSSNTLTYNSSDSLYKGNIPSGYDDVYFFIQVVDNAGNATIWNPPSVPKIVKMNGITIYDTVATLKVHSIEDASNIRYYFQLATNKEFTQNVLTSPALTDTVWTTPTLINKTTYYWRVKSVDSYGLAQGWSATIDSFYIVEPKFEQDLNSNLVRVRSSSIALGDYNGDSVIDLIITGLNSNGNPITRLYKGTATGYVRDYTRDVNLPGVYSGSVAFGDIDNDKDLDLVISGNNGTTGICNLYKNEGGYGRYVFYSSLVGVTSSSVAFGDYDNDGDFDLIVTGLNGASKVSKLYKNTSGVFTEDTSSSLTGIYNGKALFFDYDNDGDLDLLIAGLSETSIFKLYRNDNGKFSEDTRSNFVKVFGGDIKYGDYDGDGDFDLIISGRDDAKIRHTKLYKNDGTGLFVYDTNSSLLKQVQQSSVAFGDYDNDGDLDLVVGGTNGGTSYLCKVYNNNGMGVFIEDTDVVLPGIVSGAVAFGDIDNDGDLDLVVTGNNTAKVYKNRCKVVNTKPNHPYNLASSSVNGKLVLSWAVPADDKTLKNSITYNIRVGTTSGGHQICSGMVPVGFGNRGLKESISLNLPAGTYYWSVQAVDNGLIKSTWATEKVANHIVNPVPSIRLSGLPTVFELSQNYPNPFNPETIISYQLPVISNVELKVYNITGQLIRTLVNGKKDAGYYKVKWNGKDEQGKDVSSGIYIYRINAGEFTSTKRMIMVK